MHNILLVPSPYMITPEKASIFIYIYFLFCFVWQTNKIKQELYLLCMRAHFLCSTKVFTVLFSSISFSFFCTLQCRVFFYVWENGNFLCSAAMFFLFAVQFLFLFSAVHGFVLFCGVTSYVIFLCIGSNWTVLFIRRL